MLKFVMSFFTPTNDQEGPKPETKGDPPTRPDSESPSYEVIRNPFQSPEPPHLGPPLVEPPHVEATIRPRAIMRKPPQHVHSNSQMMLEKYGRLKERCATLSQERDDLRNQMLMMEGTINQHVDQLHHSKSFANALQDQLAATRAELVQVRQDLQASRSFVSTEASDDGKALVDMLSVLNQKIDEFAYVVGDLVPQQIGEAHFTPPKTEKGLADMGPVGALGDFAIQTNVALADVLQYGIQHATCKYLLSTFFMRFVPAMDRSLSHHFNELHRSLSLHYPQAYVGRWRAMTYSHIRPQSIEISKRARWWVEETLAFVNLCAPGCRPAEGALPMNALEKAEEMFRAALDLQDKAKTAYLAYDYEVFAVDVGSRFKEREMKYGGDDRKKQKGHGEVLAVLGLGLKAWRSVCEDEGRYVRDEVIPVRVSVLTTAVLTTV